MPSLPAAMRMREPGLRPVKHHLAHSTAKHKTQQRRFRHGIVKLLGRDALAADANAENQLADGVHDHQPLRTGSLPEDCASWGRKGVMLHGICCPEAEHAAGRTPT